MIINKVQSLLTRLFYFCHTPFWLFLLLTIVLVLRVPSFFEPYSYGDEMVYLTLGNAVREGIPLYEGIHDNKPPLLYLTAALAGNLLMFKAILAVWSLLTIFFFYKLMVRIFPKNNRTQILSVFIFAILTTIPKFEGNIVNAENFIIGFSILGFWCLLDKKLTYKTIAISGLLFSIASLYKVPAAFDIFAALLLLLLGVKTNLKSLLTTGKKVFIFLLAFFLPISAVFLWYFMNDNFISYFTAAYLQNFGYLSSWRPSDQDLPFLYKNAPLIFRGALLALSYTLLLIFQKKLSKPYLLTTAWLGASLFAAMLSERPYPHYLLQLMAPLSILLAILFTIRSFEQSLVVIPLAFTFFFPYRYKYWNYETFSYYQRFYNLITNRITKQDYLLTFGGHVPRTYSVSDHLIKNTKADERVFVIGDNASIYALSRRLPPIRYVVDYHINDFSSETEVAQLLNKNLPSIIVVMPNAVVFPSVDRIIKLNYAQTEIVDKATIYKLLNSKIRGLIAS